jgi:hypothetical protein
MIDTREIENKYTIGYSLYTALVNGQTYDPHDKESPIPAIFL